MSTAFADAPPALLARAAEEGVAENEHWRLPFSLPSFQTKVAALRESVVAGWQRWTEQAVLTAELAELVPRDDEDWGWKSFVREVAVARQCSDQAAAKEVFLAVALVTSHPRTLELLRAGRMPQFHAVVLIEESAGCTPDVIRRVEAELAERACDLTPSRIRAQIRKIELQLDPDGAAARSAEAARDRGVRMHAGKDDQRHAGDQRPGAADRQVLRVGHPRGPGRPRRR